MSGPEFQPGRVYFAIAFADADEIKPAITSYEFVACHAFRGEIDPLYEFRLLPAFRFEVLSPECDTEDAPVLLTEQQANRLVSLEGLVCQIESVRARLGG